MNDPCVVVGLAQVDSVLGNVEANLERHLEWIRRGRQAGAELLVFPEMSLTGYFIQDLAKDVALRLDSPVFERLRAASREYRLDLVVGFAEESPRYVSYLSAAYLSQGEITHVHRKVYPPTYGMFADMRFFGAGDRVRVFSTRFGRAALFVCEDAWHVALPYVAWVGGAETLIIHSCSPGRGVAAVDQRLGSAASWELLTRLYAQFFTNFVIHCNRVGYEDGVNFWGGSSLVAPDGEVIAKGPYLEEALVIGTLDFAALRRERAMLPIVREEKPDLILRELGRVLDQRRADGALW